MALLLALARNVPQAHASLSGGAWERSKYSGVEVHEKTLGVIGFGRIGQLVAERAKGFGMHVLAFDAYVAEEIFERLGMVDAWMALSPERKESYGDRVVVMHDTTTKPPRPLDRFQKDDGLAWVNPSSSGIGPMRDLVRLAEALRRGGELDGERILSAQAVEAMTSRHRTTMRDETFGAVIDWGLGAMVNSWHYDQKPTPYGYGDHASRRAFGHGGMQSSIVFADPEKGLAVAFGCNGMAGEPNNHRRTQPVLTALYEDLGLA